MSKPGTHADGFRWLKDVITNDGPAYTLESPHGHWIAHVVRHRDRTWEVIEHDGPSVASGLATAGDAMKIADNEWRGCAYDSGLPHGLCDNERVPWSESAGVVTASIYCKPCGERVARENAASDDMDRIEANRGGCPVTSIQVRAPYDTARVRAALHERLLADIMVAVDTDGAYPIDMVVRIRELLHEAGYHPGQVDEDGHLIAAPHGGDCLVCTRMGGAR